MNIEDLKILVVPTEGQDEINQDSSYDEIMTYAMENETDVIEYDLGIYMQEQNDEQLGLHWSFLVDKTRRVILNRKYNSELAHVKPAVDPTDLPKDGAHLTPVRTSLREILIAARHKILKQYGDQGTCVMGMNLLYKGAVIATQPVQGNITTHHYYNEVKEQLVNLLDYNMADFSVDQGVMD